MPFLVTTLDAEFLGHISKMEAFSKAAADATFLTAQRMWHYPPLGSWDGDPMNIAGMNGAFDRTALNNLYKEVLSDQDQQGRLGEAMVVKLQIDYISAQERAFRTRHCSSVRARIHAAARRRGQGDPDGVFTGNVVVWLERMLAAAHDVPEGYE